MLNIGGEKIAKMLPDWMITTHGKPGKKTLYLSFDDGPNEKFTIPLCELLDKYSAKATFFCIGKNVEKHPDIAKQIVQRGHMIANHSDNHKAFGKLKLSDQIAEAENCDSRIQSICPGSPKIFRAPQGQLKLSLLFRLKSSGWTVVHWSYDSQDYLNRPLKDQLDFLRKRPVVDGDILLFHDDNQLAIDLLARMLPIWAKEGYEFRTIQGLVSR